MFSKVDTESSLAAVALGKDRRISTGVSVSRLATGAYAVSAHAGDRRVIVELTPAELADLAAQIRKLE